MSSSEAGPESGSVPASAPVRDLPGVAAFLSLGTTIAVCVGLGMYGGILADDGWRIAPWGLFAGLVLGVAIAVLSVVTLVRRWL